LTIFHASLPFAFADNVAAIPGFCKALKCTAALIQRINAMGTAITFKRADSTDTKGYLAKAGLDHAPAVIVIQEWWGLQNQITGICDRLALAGYDALAPDLYGGTIVPYHDSAAADKEMSSLNFLDATDKIVRGAAQYLLQASRKVGLMGFCLGGAVTVLGAVRVPELHAACCFYGIPPESAGAPSDIKVPFQAHFATRDDWCTPELVATFEQGLKLAKVKSELFRYDADHAFVNEQRSVHDRAAAEMAWGRMLSFWEQHLEG
jgi:carboxymethylenebutenolidase